MSHTVTALFDIFNEQKTRADCFKVSRNLRDHHVQPSTAGCRTKAGTANVAEISIVALDCQAQLRQSRVVEGHMLLLLTVSSALKSLSSRASPDECTDINDCRRLFDIVWGCLVTIFLCIWISVHPNVPPPLPLDRQPSTEAGLWIRARWLVVDVNGPLIRRIKLMGIALLAPELIFGLAARQLAVARFFSQKYDISLTRGFFIGMGGFVDEDGHPIVTCAQLSELGVLEAVRRVPQAAIDDKSKGDFFSKAISLSQGVWFIVRCITRGIQHLPLTELEIATLAFATINATTFLLWWGKPLDVRDPIMLAVKIAAQNQPGDAPRPIKPPLPWTSRLEFLLFNSYTTEDHDPYSSKFVPTFWSASSADDAGKNIAVALVFQFYCSVVFGGIHCAAWDVAFPSVAEKWLWRVAALAIVLLPAILASTSPSQMKMTLIPIAVMYCVSRVVLLVLPLTTLRTLPPAVFVDIDWSIYIPHL